MRYTRASSGLFTPPCNRLRSFNVRWKKIKRRLLVPAIFGTIRICLNNRSWFSATCRIHLPKLLSKKTWHFCRKMISQKNKKRKKVVPHSSSLWSLNHKTIWILRSSETIMLQILMRNHLPQKPSGSIKVYQTKIQSQAMKKHFLGKCSPAKNNFMPTNVTKKKSEDILKWLKSKQKWPRSKYNNTNRSRIMQACSISSTSQ